MEKKGQAAMEFLMTYGWAILAAIIAIGVLAYFGVFSPGKYAPKAAIVNPPFYANAWNVKGGVGISEVNLEIKNNGGEAYTVSNVVVSGCGSDGVDQTIAAGDAGTFTASCGDLTVGDPFSGDITITYTKSGSLVELSSTGSISDTVVA